MGQLKSDFKDPTVKFVTIEKQPQPFPWINVNNETFKPGSIGATSEKTGFMWILDSGEIEFGALKKHYQEYWLKSKNKTMNGRFVIRSLPNIWKSKSIDEGDEIKTGTGAQVNMSWFANPVEPYVLSERAMKNKWMPPNEVPALPKFIRDQIPVQYKYWNLKDRDARKLRDELIIYNKEKKIEFINTEKDGDK